MTFAETTADIGIASGFMIFSKKSPIISTLLLGIIQNKISMIIKNNNKNLKLDDFLIFLLFEVLLNLFFLHLMK